MVYNLYLYLLKHYSNYLRVTEYTATGEIIRSYFDTPTGVCHLWIIRTGFLNISCVFVDCISDITIPCPQIKKLSLKRSARNDVSSDQLKKYVWSSLASTMNAEE